jgi:hypothetical protein
MSLKVSFPIAERGNTVPYPPLFEGLRRNRGFIDLRGKPELATTIEETKDSPGLLALLTDLAQPSSYLISLGCDLGQHVEDEQPPNSIHVAGGYVQITFANLKLSVVDNLLKLARMIEARSRRDVGDRIWEIKFELMFVHLRFDELIEAHSIWLWFFASSSSPKRAIKSREALLNSLRHGMRESAGLVALASSH